MVYPRLIPCLLIKNGLLVRSQLFRVHQAIGNPMSTVRRFSDWNVDELVILDISKEDYHDLRRDDLAQHYAGFSFLDVLAEIARTCFMPLSVGGRIRTCGDIGQRLAAGADKVIINTRAVDHPEFITEAARRFGSQCIVASIDVLRHEDDTLEVYVDGGSRATGLNPIDHAREMERRGAGEILLNAIHRDGSASGYDLDLVQRITAAVGIPVICCGGVGSYDHFAPGILEGGADAVAAANIFHFFELSYPLARKACMDAGVAMRHIGLGSRYLQREPRYDPPEQEDRRRNAARQRNRSGEQPRSLVRWCTRCVYPGISAAPMEFDADGVCMGCRMSEVKNAITADEWTRRGALLREIAESYRCHDGSRYDCVIPVSGGKDSYFQVHVVTQELGLNPLLVTYNGNNYTEVGWRNVHRMKEVFNVDHIFFSPGVDLLIKLNRLGLEIMGDMNWHAHVGITTLPIRIAVQHKVPLLFWGEHGYLDLCGQFSMDDFPEMSYRDRLEHFARGYEWNYMVGREGITARQMLAYRYPSDQELFDLNLRGIYLGNYLHWEANDHLKLVVERYGFEVSDEPFDRTYRTMSNLDDMHENGVHDYLKYIKFGYGRATDHVCKDIRAGLMDREQGIAMVRRYDHVKPRDLQRWLRYTGMDEATFDRIADTFRDIRVWRRDGNEWYKDNIWD